MSKFYFMTKEDLPLLLTCYRLGVLATDSQHASFTVLKSQNKNHSFQVYDKWLKKKISYTDFMEAYEHYLLLEMVAQHLTRPELLILKAEESTLCKETGGMYLYYALFNKFKSLKENDELFITSFISSMDNTDISYIVDLKENVISFTVYNSFKDEFVNFENLTQSYEYFMELLANDVFTNAVPV